MRVSGLLAPAGTAAERMSGRAIGPCPLRAARARSPAVRREPAPLTTAARSPVAACRGLAAAARPVRSAMPGPKRLAMPTSAPTAGVVHRKLGNPPLGHLALDPRQRRPNELAMNRALSRRGVGRLPVARSGRRISLARPGFEIARGVRRRGHPWRRGRSDDHAGRRQRRRTGRRLLLPRRRHFRLAIHVFRVARRAAHLADVAIHQRHDRMIADAPLARTVVFYKLTNSKLALHH